MRLVATGQKTYTWTYLTVCVASDTLSEFATPPIPYSNYTQSLWVSSYANACSTTLTSDPAYLATLFPVPFGPGNKLFTMPMSGEPVPAFTSDYRYPAILVPEPFNAVI